MRFAICVVAAVGTGAVSMTALQTLVPGNASVFEAVRALGGDPANFKLPDINPVKAYQDVMREVTSGRSAGSLKFDTKPLPSFKITGPLFKPYEYKPDPGVQRAISAGIGARIGQDIRHAQDISAYGRNPTAWHGIPPR